MQGVGHAVWSGDVLSSGQAVSTFYKLSLQITSRKYEKVVPIWNFRPGERHLWLRASRTRHSFNPLRAEKRRASD